MAALLGEIEKQGVTDVIGDDVGLRRPLQPRADGHGRSARPGSGEIREPHAARASRRCSGGTSSAATW
ncbi:MAG: hypothetical protein MZV70_15855 [Desulfobacterales bacterium]|nr:hypothetical protein [Desulfobacterales bacterium]